MSNILALNLNRKALDFQEPQVKRVLYMLEKKIETEKDTAEKHRLVLRKYEIEFQYNDYCSVKGLSKSDERRARRVQYGQLIGDRYAALMANGCIDTAFKYVYNVDLSHCLALALSLTFHDSYEECKRNLQTLSEESGYSLDMISRYFLNNNVPGNELGDLDLTYENIFDLSKNMKEFFGGVLIRSNEENIPLLDCISTSPYNSIINVDDNCELTVAISLKLWETLEGVLMNLISDAEDQIKKSGANYNISSKYLPGFTIYTSQPVNINLFVYIDKKTPVYIDINNLEVGG